MAHCRVRHPAGDLRSCKSAVLPICHILFLDGVYCVTEAGLSFRRVKATTPAALDLLVHTLSERLARHLERRGLLVRDPVNEFLTLGASDDSTLDELRGHSIPYRIALGPHAGRKAFTLQTLPSTGEFERGLMGSHSTRVWSPLPMSARNWNGYAAPSHGLR